MSQYYMAQLPLLCHYQQRWCFLHSFCRHYSEMFSSSTYVFLFKHFEHKVLQFLHAKAAMLSARLSRRNSVRLSVRLSVCPSHGWIRQKRRKLGSPIYTVSCPEDSSFKNRKAFPEIRWGPPRTRP